VRRASMGRGGRKPPVSELAYLGIVADIGGTHARFATVRRADRGILTLDNRSTLRTADFPSLESAFQSYRATLNFAPRFAVFGLASPIDDSEIKLTNNPWVLHPQMLGRRLGLEKVSLINDFEAIARSISILGSDQYLAFGAAPLDLPEEGVISVVGPGSGLGVGMLLRNHGNDRILASEGGHVGFPPADEIDDYILRFVRTRYQRVSAERLVSGPGLVHIYEALAEMDGRAIVPAHPIPLWQAALEDRDPHACAAVERWLMLLGTFAGDVALTHRADAVVLAGGILPRFGKAWDMTAFLSRFYAKGRFEPLMRRIALARIDYQDPGLLGAARLLGELYVESPASVAV